MTELRHCSSCSEEVPVELFMVDNGGAYMGLTNPAVMRCPNCQKIIQKPWSGLLDFENLISNW